MTASVRIGTSGYSFSDWVGTVYPEGTRSADMLHTYAQDFDAVEINFTYYRDPTPSIFEGMLRKVDTAFDFVIKAPRGLTHERDQAATIAPSFVASLAPLRDAGQLGGVLVQFPQAFHADEAGFDHLKRIADLLVSCGITANVEFRHNSWTCEPVYELLRKLELGFVNVDLPRIGTLPGPTNVSTNGVAYYRLHGRNAAHWHNAPTGSLRYDYFYSDAELEEWAQRIEVAGNDVAKVYVFTNNCHKGSSFVNALRLKQRFDQAVRSDAEAAGTLFASSDPQQRVTDLARRVAAARASGPSG